MPITSPPESLNLTSFADLEKQLAEIVDAVTKVAQAIDDSPLVKWIVPAQYRGILDEIVRVLEAADGFLHKTP